MKKLKIILSATAALLLTALVFQYGCKKAQLGQTNSDYEQLIAAQDYSNNELVRLIKLTDPPLSDHELMGIMIAASPLDDNIIKELLKRGQPPCRCALSDETLQMILLFNLPLSDHIQKEMEKAGIELDKNLLDNIDLADLPDMDIEKANLLMEKLLNLKFGCGECEFQTIETVRDTVQVFGTLESGEYFVLAQEFIDVIDNLDLRCSSASDGVTIPCLSKHIRVVDMEIIDLLTPAGDRIIDVVLVLPIALNFPEPVLCDFGPNESWNFGLGDINAGGYCAGPLVGQSLDKDATTELEKKLHLCPFVSFDIGDFNSFWTVTNISPLDFNFIPQILNTGDPVIEDCLYDYYLFYSSEGIGCMLDGCLEASPTLPPAYAAFSPKHEMRFYRQGAEIIANHPQIKPQFDAVPIAYDLNYVIDFCGPFCSVYYHTLSVTYGIP